MERPRVGVATLLRRGGQVLLVRRKYAPRQGCWGLPGGKLEWGETLLEAAMRELREETGLEADPLEVITALDVIDREGEAVQLHYVLVVVGAGAPRGEPVLGDDAAEVGWFAPEALPAPLCPEVPGLLRATA